MNVVWYISNFENLSAIDLYQLLQLRINVFMIEQNCLYPECDNKDLVSKHLFGKIDDQIIAYARLLPPHISYEDPSIGRVIVREDKRHLKLGSILMKKAIESISLDFPNQTIRISAQAHLQSFYNNLGFVSTGEIYLEDNIPHIEMELKRAK